MESEVLQAALTQGVWATLAVGLILYNLKSQEKRDLKQDTREDNYQKIIINFSQQLNVVNDLKEDITVIKNCIVKK